MYENPPERAAAHYQPVRYVRLRAVHEPVDPQGFERVCHHRAVRNPTASTIIDAPLAVVWAVMLDTASYGEWNPFVERAECPSPPTVGDPIVLHVRWANGRTTRSPERISAVEPPSTDADGVTTACLSYVYEGLPAKLGLVRGTRHQRLRQEAGEPTSYDTVE